ncbi:glycosyltransferase [Fodinibius roseus]|uniref:Glycosyltransferase n=1 Tax=Fodinibius roseus TaxID=1194090 RepID=A0A1M4SQW0_9BACT|nr:glycosyltransferase family 2 protein [Fodinibius roseus]SHE34633.1 glycosyltransferase [Fodinibius roseus]
MSDKKKGFKISVITICFNNEQEIRDTIESVVDQAYDEIEYIVVDGNSMDNTMAIIREYSEHINTIISEPDEGMYDAINKGFRLATGDVVGLIHAGDRLFDDQVISRIAEHFISNDIDAMYGHSILVNKEDEPVRVNKSPEFRKSLFKVGWMPSHQSVYIKKEVIERLGNYRTDLGGSADYEFVLRYFYFNDLKVKRLDAYILRFAMGGRSTSNYHKIFKSQAIQKKCWKLNGEAPPFYMIPLKLLRKIPQFYKALKM